MRILTPAVVITVISLVTSVANAADLPLPRSSTQVAPFTSSPMNWTGFYAGLNAGYGWSSAITATIADPNLAKSQIFTSATPGGFVGGAQAGYNWQSGYWVFGFEADIQYADLGASMNWGNYTALGLKNGDGQYFGTLRARLGYAMDRTLVYITGGYAYGGLIDNRFTGNATSNSGYALGGGVEYAFTDNWTARLEGLYVNLDSKARNATFNANGNGYTLNVGQGDGAGLVRAGVNYKF